MDPASLITQAKRSEVRPNSENNDPVILKQNTIGNSESIDKNRNDKEYKSTCEPLKNKKTSTFEFSSSQPSFGSRFLSQLLCCFGLGHVPDYHYGNGAVDSQCIVVDSSMPEVAPPNPDTTTDSVANCDWTDETHVLLSDSNNPESAISPGLLSPPVPDVAGRICAVIDLDETLVHSSFQCSEEADFSIEVEVEGVQHQIFVMKRPFVDEFLARVGQLFECVLFTASMGKYADPVTDALDPGGAIRHRLFREACVFHYDSYVKDLGTLGRPLDRCFIIDNSPAAYMFNLEHAIHVSTWTGEPGDTELRDLLPYLEGLAKAESVSEYFRANPSPTGTPISMAQVLVAMQNAAVES